MGRKLHLFLSLELLLSRCKQASPMIIEGGTTVGFACPRQEQWISLLQVFQPPAALWVVLGTLCPNVIPELFFDSRRKINAFLFAPSTPFVLNQGSTRLLASSVAAHRHFNDFGETCAGLS